MGIKDKVKEWAWETWDAYVKEPIAQKTEELENEAVKQIETYSQKAKETAWKPVDYYRKQESFYRGVILDLCRIVDCALDCEWELKT